MGLCLEVLKMYRIFIYLKQDDKCLINNSHGDVLTVFYGTSVIIFMILLTVFNVSL